MRAPLLLLAVAAGPWTLAATAQLTVVIPNGYAAADGNAANVFPFGHAIAPTYQGLRIQTIYDSSHFTAQSVNTPILIQGIRFRANGSSATWSGGTYTLATIDMSTAPLDHTLATTNYATNHGADLLRVHNGPVVVMPGTGAGTGVPGPWHVDVRFGGAPFLYDPSSGDLIIDIDVVAGAWGGGGLTALDTVNNTGTPPSNTSRVYASTNYPNANGVDSIALICEITYVPAAGLYSIFSATPTTGASPLMVQFTDQSYSSDPAGVLAWRWDFENDGVVDSTVQNPVHTYTSCADFDVSLTVIDAAHPPSTTVRTGLIRTDSVNPSFTVALLAPPNIFQFTDTTSPAATAWAWDFENDGIVDSTLQHPVWVAPGSCVSTEVAFTATRLCRTATIVEPVFAAPNPPVTGELGGGNGTTSSTQVGNFFDLRVTTPEGIKVCGVVITPYTFTGPVDVEVYATETTHLGKEANAAAWRLVGSGTGTALGGTFNGPPTAIDVGVTPFYLPAGDYGMAVYIRNPSGTASLAYTNGPASAPYVHPDLTIHPAGIGSSSVSLFGGVAFTPRLWNGGFHYTKCSQTGEAAYGFFGTGCPGSLGVARLDATSLPRIGSSLTVDISNLPQNAAIMVLGLSNTSSLFGPLPVNLGILGAPGCFGRVSTDANTLVLGAGNQATWSLALPNNPVLACTLFYNQALVLNAGFNALGAVMSDAAGGTIGF